MKNLIKVSMLVLVVLTALAGCELFGGINVAWNIDTFSYNPGNGLTFVTYTAQNLGKVDLTGVNLQIGLDVGGIYASAWTPDFDLRQNQITHGSLFVYTGANPIGATVLSVDMDTPSK